MKQYNKKPDNEKKSSISVVNLSTYTSPVVKEVKNLDWIGYGEDNDYYQYLQDRINGSPTNNAIVNGISQMIYGQGLDSTEKNIKPEDYAQAMLLFDDDTLERLCYDLKGMGQCAIQVVYSLDKTRIVECNHFPIETLRSGKCDENGDIRTYYYSDDWSEISNQNKPIPIPAFGFGDKTEEEILFIKPYRTGYYYYSPVDYQGGLQYCEIEEEIANYHLNNILNGLSPSMLINFNNGRPTETEQKQIERDIALKFSGSSNAGRFILSFNDTSQYNATIEPVQLSDAHNQYQFISDESMKKIMVSHRVISPMLLGIKDQTGFGNNADELRTASILMDNTVIRPFQNLIIKNLEKILDFNNISLKLYFKTLQPLEFTQVQDIVPQQQLSAVPELTDYIAEEISKKINETGEVISDAWELVATRKYDKNNVSIEKWVKDKIKLSAGGYITSYPNEKSTLDETYYKVRYSYEEEYSSGNSRKFCVNMMGRTSNGVVYRKEDIDMASFQGVNNDFGHKGQNYSLFEYKGGPNCGHYWSEQLYQRKIGANGLPVPDKALSSNQEVSSIAGYNPTPRGWDNAQTAPKDMPDNGHHPDWVAKHRK